MPLLGYVNFCENVSRNFFFIFDFFQATIHFEVYATFDPITEKNDAFAAANKLIKWAKKEESNLFILSSPTF